MIPAAGALLAAVLLGALVLGRALRALSDLDDPFDIDIDEDTDTP